MTENQLPSADHSGDEQTSENLPDVSQRDCVNCAQNKALEGFPTPLCPECRQKMIRFPIPVWIRLFAGAILLVVIYSSFSFPRQLDVGLHMAKGKQAVKEHKYLTAGKEFEKAGKYLNNNLELNANLFICAVFNGNVQNEAIYWKRIEGKSFDDEELRASVSDAVDIANKSLNSDELVALGKQYSGSIPDTTLARLTDQRPDDQSFAITYALYLYVEEKYDSAARVISKVLDRDAFNIGALETASRIAVMRKLPDSALDFCDRVLKMNAEDVEILSSKARNLLRLRRDMEARRPADDAYHLADTSSYTIGTMVLYYHFTGDSTRELQYLRKLTAYKDTTDASTVQYIMHVLSNKEPFRTTK